MAASSLASAYGGRKTASTINRSELFMKYLSGKLDNNYDEVEKAITDYVMLHKDHDENLLEYIHSLMKSMIADSVRRDRFFGGLMDLLNIENRDDNTLWRQILGKWDPEIVKMLKPLIFASIISKKNKEIAIRIFKPYNIFGKYDAIDLYYTIKYLIKEGQPGDFSEYNNQVLKSVNGMDFSEYNDQVLELVKGMNLGESSLQSIEDLMYELAKNNLTDALIYLTEKGYQLLPEDVEPLRKIRRLRDLMGKYAAKMSQLPTVRSPVRSPVRSSTSEQINYVLNPKTLQRIEIGGPTYRKLIDEGYELINGKMRKL